MARIPTIRSGISRKERGWKRLRRASGTWAGRMTMSRMRPSGLSMTLYTPTVRRWCVMANPMARSKKAHLGHMQGVSIRMIAPGNRPDLAVMLSAGERDQRTATRLILVMRGLRSLAYGLLAVILGVVLAVESFSPTVIRSL